MAADARIDYVQRLGAELRNRRMARGMSLRALAKELNLSGHGTLVDYEHGRRIPPENLVIACERVLQVSDGSLRDLREKALAERADRNVEEMLRPAPQASSADTSAAPRSRRWVLVAAAVLAVVAAVGVWQWWPSSHAAGAGGSVRFGFENGTQRWSPLWGNDKVTFLATSAVAYEGRQSLQVTTVHASNDEDKSIGTTHGLDSLRAGMKVTVAMRAAGQVSVRFFAYDSRSDPFWAPETQKGDEAPVAETDWKTYVWTVPDVDEVTAIGVEVYQISDAPVTLWVDAVNW